MKHLSLRPRALAVTGMAAVAFLVPSTASASGPAGDPAKAGFEQTFIAETIDHHFMGVKMGRLCMDRARNGRLSNLCTAIVVNQSMELSRMRDDFLLTWYGVEKHPMLMEADVAMLKELSKRKGKRFDIALSRAFIEHHEMQIERSEACLTSAEHHALIHTCMDQIDTQQDEIKQFRGVLRAYGLKR